MHWIYKQDSLCKYGFCFWLLLSGCCSLQSTLEASYIFLIDILPQDFYLYRNFQKIRPCQVSSLVRYQTSGGTLWPYATCALYPIKTLLISPLPSSFKISVSYCSRIREMAKWILKCSSTKLLPRSSEWKWVESQGKSSARPWGQIEGNSWCCFSSCIYLWRILVGSQ